MIWCLHHPKKEERKSPIPKSPAFPGLVPPPPSCALRQSRVAEALSADARVQCGVGDGVLAVIGVFIELCVAKQAKLWGFVVYVCLDQP